MILLQLALGLSDDADVTRRLVVSGNILAPGKYAFAATVMYCEPAVPSSPKLIECAAFCGGSLASTNSVLTSANCLMDSSTGALSMSLSSMYVLVGSPGRSTMGPQGRIVKVTSVSHPGYGSTPRYSLDDDIALLFLDSCIDPIPGVIEPVKLATPDSEKADACTSVSVVGMGRSSTAPDSVYVDDGAFRSTSDHIHSPEICSEEFVAQVLSQHNISSISMLNSTDQIRLNTELLSDKFLCSGGDTVQSICFGDSGSPVMSSLAPIQQVGVTVFLVTGECGLGPDYSTRVAFYAQWISQQLSAHPCLNWNVSDSFTTWPVTARTPSANYTSSRCASSQWQCISDGICLDAVHRCNGRADCADGSDEGSCPSRQLSRVQSTVSLGSSVTVPVRNLGTCTQPLIDVSTSVLSSKAGGCGDKLASVNASIAAFHASDNDTDADALANQCTALATCVSSLVSQAFPAWFAKVSVCPIDPALLAIASVCVDMGSYVAKSDERQSYANLFNSRYSIQCDSVQVHDGGQTPIPTDSGGVQPPFAPTAALAVFLIALLVL